MAQKPKAARAVKDKPKTSRKPAKAPASGVVASQAPVPADTTVKKVRGRPFVAGQPSPNPSGRPAGSRNKISEAFITALSADFEANGVAVIADVRANSPASYLKLVADLVPKDFNVKQDASEAFVLMWKEMGGGNTADA